MNSPLNGELGALARILNGWHEDNVPVVVAGLHVKLLEQHARDLLDRHRYCGDMQLRETIPELVTKGVQEN